MNPLSVGEILQKVLLLVSAVDTLKAEQKRLNDLLMDHHERIIRLENSAELIAEKAKNAAMGAVNATTMQVARDVFELRAKVELLKPDGGAMIQMRSGLEPGRLPDNKS